MTLIPLISAIVTTPERVTAPAGAAELPRRGSYNPGAGHRPLAATLAIGLPAALVVAVALSPMIVEQPPVLEPIHGTLIDLPTPPPPPPPEPTADEKATPKTASATETVKPRIDTSLPSDNVAEKGPSIPDPVWTDPGPTVVPDPPKPPLILAELDPRYAGMFQPDYPASEQRREIEGMAKVRVLIGTDGRVKAVEQVSATSPGFFEETKRRALAKWRFKPATRDGVAEESWKVMTVRFQIRNG